LIADFALAQRNRCRSKLWHNTGQFCSSDTPLS
jgi:hypothetical protein